MGDIRASMEQFPDAMSTIALDYTEALVLCLESNLVTNLPIHSARLADPNSSL
jgi:hypothetical protein